MDFHQSGREKALSVGLLPVMQRKCSVGWTPACRAVLPRRKRHLQCPLHPVISLYLLACLFLTDEHRRADVIAVGFQPLQLSRDQKKDTENSWAIVSPKTHNPFATRWKKRITTEQKQRWSYPIFMASGKDVFGKQRGPFLERGKRMLWSNEFVFLGDRGFWGIPVIYRGPL